MDDRKAQKELFEFEKAKRSFSGIRKIISLPKITFGITLSLERLIFISIAIIMTMVMIYAFGVEEGKRLAQGMAESAPSKPQALTPPTVQPGVLQAVQPKAEVARPEAQNNLYTIVAAAFSNKVTAQLETERLRKDNLEAYLVQSGSYYQIRIGSFPTKESGLKILKRIQKIYKDAYIKMR